MSGKSIRDQDVFYVNKFEIIKLENSEPEYQYFMKDHLGNVRLTFTTKEDKENVLATMEFANRPSESAQFERYDKVRIVNSSPLFDHTNSPSTGSAIRLSGNDHEKTGLVKTLSVMPGDVIQMEVYAKYLDTDEEAWSEALEGLVLSIASGSSPYKYTSILNGGLRFHHRQTHHQHRSFSTRSRIKVHGSLNQV